VNRVKCPDCGKGWDYEGEGCCDFCKRKEFRPVNGLLLHEEDPDDLTMWPAWQRENG
jgi:hypothetical protein